MKKCLVIINSMSGNFDSLNQDDLLKYYASGFDIDVQYIDSDYKMPKGDYSRIIVCGGDGTLNNMLNTYGDSPADLFYLPCGTLNEVASNAKISNRYYINDCGKVDNKFFTYVVASGTFTELGYCVNNSEKKKFKFFAYLNEVTRYCRVRRINATIKANNKTDSGEYTLIMVINNRKCFGLKFNKMFKPDDGVVHLLTVKSPKMNGLFGLVKMGFQFFRIFFMGFKKPYYSKNITFEPIETMELLIENETDFCLDGECYKVQSGIHTIQASKLGRVVNIIDPKNFIYNVLESTIIKYKGKR